MNQKQKAIDFLQKVASGECDRAFGMHCHENFKHHNPWFEGSASPLKKAMQENADAFPEKQLKVHQTVEDGDRVVLYSEMRHHDQESGYALVHIFKFMDDKILELWDVAMEIPKDMKNENGMF